jgi:acetyltransferase-like isoleucine patch superfamily enzyme
MLDVMLPRHSANDTVARLIQWLVADGKAVRAGQSIAVFESTKTAYEVEARADGYLFHLLSAGVTVRIGSQIAIIADSAAFQPPPGKEAAAPACIVSRKAQELMKQFGLTDTDLPAGVGFITSATILGLVGADEQAAGQNWVDVPVQRGHGALVQGIADLRGEMRARFNRHVPTGTLLNDRWQLARNLGFGDGASIYDESLVLGDVRIGRHCWIGPCTVLDGDAAPLTIGDWNSIGAGSQIYTHHSIDWALTGGAAKSYAAPTTIGSCCFISPLSVIGPGSTIGKHSFVATGSYVQGDFPAFSYIAGSPAAVVGRVEVNGAIARLVLGGSKVQEG